MFICTRVFVNVFTEGEIRHLIERPLTWRTSGRYIVGLNNKFKHELILNLYCRHIGSYSLDVVSKRLLLHLLYYQFFLIYVLVIYYVFLTLSSECCIHHFKDIISIPSALCFKRYEYILIFISKLLCTFFAHLKTLPFYNLFNHGCAASITHSMASSSNTHIFPCSTVHILQFLKYNYIETGINMYMMLLLL